MLCSSPTSQLCLSDVVAEAADRNISSILHDDAANYNTHTAGENIINIVSPAVSAFWHAIAEVKQFWSVIGWVTKNLLSPAATCFGRHFKP
jgi:hypothetical protein